MTDVPIKFKAPCALHLYLQDWRGGNSIRSSGQNLPLDQETDPDELTVRVLHNEEEVVLSMAYWGAERFVLVRDIDDSLAELCAKWRKEQTGPYKGIDPPIFRDMLMIS